MKLSKFAYLYSKPLENHTLKIMKKYHGILSVRKSGDPASYCSLHRRRNFCVIILVMSFHKYCVIVWYNSDMLLRHFRLRLMVHRHQNR